MTASARARVALRYTALFGLVALITAAGIYWLIRDNAYYRLNQTLESTLEVATLTLFHEIQENGDKAAGEAAVRDVFKQMYQKSFPGEQVAIWDGQRLVAYKKNLGRDLSNLSQLPPMSADGFRNTADLRIETRHVLVPEVKTTYTVAVATWRGDVLNDMASVFRALSIAIPAALFLAAAGGYVLAKRTLAPLTSMASTVDAITSNNLDQRVQVVNPNDELGQLAIRFNKLLARLQEAFQQQRRFMADAAHELKTPITAALVAAQVTLQGGERDEREYREALRIIEEQMSRLKQLVQNMFLLAQADAHAVAYHPEPVYFDEIIAEGYRAMRFLAESKGIAMHMAGLPELSCLGDAGLLRQAVIILLDNARKFTPASGRIDVSVEMKNETYVLRISDTGPGIPDSAKPYLFDRFFRVDPSRVRGQADGGGAGLGLAIAKWVADVHGGDLRLESSDGLGSTFALELPRVLRAERAS